MYSFYMAVIIVVAYIALMAVFGTTFSNSIFSGKAFVCVILGAILGALISIPLNNMSTRAGLFGMGLGIAIVFLLAYTKVFDFIFHKIPASIRKAVRTVFKVAKFALGAIAIICIVCIALAVLL